MHTLSSRSRILVALASVIAVAAFLVPLWNIYLQAPQYPEGLGMRVWINQITGIKPNDLDNINNLNHYIGMKRIEPESIPELRLMPFALGALVAFGLITAWSARRALLRTWIAAFLVLALAGMVDFWEWEYDYGHNLDMENAIIKVPGMNYQPPLIGSKQLLNFRATSLPGAGAILLGASLGLGIFALVADRRPRVARLSPHAAAARERPAMA
jgi:copper chaperone NosL